MSIVHAFGAAFFLLVVPAMTCVLAAVVRRKAWWPAGFVLLTSMAMVVLCWVGVSDNTDTRFLLPAVVTTVTLFPVAFGRDRRLNAGIHALFVLGMTTILIGADAQLRVSLPWYMGDWLSLHGLVDRPFLAYFLVLAVAAAAALRIAGPRGWALPVGTALAAASCVTLALGAETWCIPSRCDFLQIASPHLRLNFLYGARWLTANVRDTNVAYTGINLPYPLGGDHLSNVVYYVNIDRHAEWRFDDYARASRRAPVHQPDDGTLAMGSGFLMPVAGDGRFDAMRPRFERVSGNRDAWKANLKTRGVRYVFISTLDPYEIDYVWHNEQGFPIEDAWARADAVAFRLVYENPGVRIYEVAT